jgi:hypothetical protein
VVAPLEHHTAHHTGTRINHLLGAHIKSAPRVNSYYNALVLDVEFAVRRSALPSRHSLQSLSGPVANLLHSLHFLDLRMARRTLDTVRQFLMSSQSINPSQLIHAPCVLLSAQLV